MKSVLCGPNTGVIGGGGDVGFASVWNSEPDLPDGSVEPASTPQRGSGKLLLAVARSVCALSKKFCTAECRESASFSLCANDVRRFGMSSANIKNTSTRAPRELFMYAGITSPFPGAPALVIQADCSDLGDSGRLLNC